MSCGSWPRAGLCCAAREEPGHPLFGAFCWAVGLGVGAGSRTSAAPPKPWLLRALQGPDPAFTLPVPFPSIGTGTCPSPGWGFPPPGASSGCALCGCPWWGGLCCCPPACPSPALGGCRACLPGGRYGTSPSPMGLEATVGRCPPWSCLEMAITPSSFRDFVPDLGFLNKTESQQWSSVLPFPSSLAACPGGSGVLEPESRNSSCQPGPVGSGTKRPPPPFPRVPDGPSLGVGEAALPRPGLRFRVCRHNPPQAAGVSLGPTCCTRGCRRAPLELPWQLPAEPGPAGAPGVSDGRCRCLGLARRSFPRHLTGTLSRDPGAAAALPARGSHRPPRSPTDGKKGAASALAAAAAPGAGSGRRRPLA